MVLGQKKGGVPFLGQGGDPATGGGVHIPRDLVHDVRGKWSERSTRWIGAAFAVIRSIFVPTLTYGHELWLVTKRTRSG